MASKEEVAELVELSTPLPEYVGRVPKYLVDTVIAEAVKAQRDSRSIVGIVANQLERQNITEVPAGFEQILSQQSYTTQRIGGIIFALDTLAARVDGQSWSQYIDTEAPTTVIN